MDERELDELEEEEFEMLVNGLIHPGDFLTPPDLIGGAYPAPFGGMAAGGPAGAAAPSPFPAGSIDDLIVQAYEEEGTDG